MYNTIGKCQDCGKEQRFLDYVSFPEAEKGFQTIAICAYGCDDMRSIAQPPAVMVDAALKKEIARLKLEMKKARAMPNKTVRAEVVADIRQRIQLCERTQEQNKFARMDADDWGRILELSKRKEEEAGRGISQRNALPDTVQGMKTWMLLKQEQRFYKELFRYAVGQCM